MERVWSKKGNSEELAGKGGSDSWGGTALCPDLLWGPKGPSQVSCKCLSLSWGKEGQVHCEDPAVLRPPTQAPAPSAPGGSSQSEEKDTAVSRLGVTTQFPGEQGPPHCCADQRAGGSRATTEALGPQVTAGLPGPPQGGCTSDAGARRRAGLRRRLTNSQNVGPEPSSGHLREDIGFYL